MTASNGAQNYWRQQTATSNQENNYQRQQMASKQSHDSEEWYTKA